MSEQSYLYGVAIKNVSLAANEVTDEKLAAIFEAKIGDWILHLPDGDFVKLSASQFNILFNKI